MKNTNNKPRHPCPSRAHVTLGMLSLLALMAGAGPAAAQDGSLPAGLASALVRSQPDVSVLSSKRCPLGPGATPSVGLLLRTPSGPTPLSVQVAMKVQGAWRLTRLPMSLQHPHGGVHDFLSDWEQDAQQPYNIACTKLPSKPLGITASSHGTFVAPFAANNARGVRHLCFPASAIYSSWACFSPVRRGGVPRSSFVQVNAE